MLSILLIRVRSAFKSTAISNAVISNALVLNCDWILLVGFINANVAAETPLISVVKDNLSAFTTLLNSEVKVPTVHYMLSYLKFYFLNQSHQWKLH